MSNTPNFPTRYDKLITDAQVAYNNQDMATAATTFAAAYDVAKSSPDWLGSLRAARGAFEATYRVNPQDTTLQGWQQSTLGAMDNTVAEIFGKSEWTVDEFSTLSSAQIDTSRNTLRELIQTNTVVGEIGLKRLVSSELDTGSFDTEERYRVAYALRTAGRMLPLVEGDGPIDQYRINWECPAFYNERLYGNPITARHIAAEALRHSHLSESPSLPTAANISPEHTARARHRAEKRAVSSVASMVLPRATVLRIANKVV